MIVAHRQTPHAVGSAYAFAVTETLPLAEVPHNAALLDFLRGRAAAPQYGRADDYGGYELHTHPDLIERLEQVVPGQPILPVYGVAVVACEGIAAIVASSMNQLLFRVPAVPPGLELKTAILPPVGEGWHALDAWQIGLPTAEGLRRLSAVARAALDHAGELSSR